MVANRLICNMPQMGPISIIIFQATIDVRGDPPCEVTYAKLRIEVLSIISFL